MKTNPDRFIVSFSLILSMLFFQVEAEANYSLRFELESKIQEKVRALIHPFDAYSQVAVTVRLKQLNVELPGGTGATVHMESSTSATSISAEDVESIDISVSTKLSPIPESLKKSIDLAIDIPASKKRLDFKKMPDDLSTLIQPRDPFAGEALGRIDSIFQKLNWLFIFSGLVIAVLGLGIFFRRKGSDAQTEALKNIANEMKEIANAGQNSARDFEPTLTQDAVSQKQPSATSSSDRDWIQALGAEGLTALLSDCYWCEQDGYAAWIWKQIRPDLAQELFRKWPVSKEYSASLSGVTESVRDDHLHPYYLKPLALEGVSLPDLEVWLKKNPAVWGEVSRMRQERVSLSLMERIELNQQKSKFLPNAFPDLPKNSQSGRELHQSFYVGSLSDEDELAILKCVSSIPLHLREQVRSLAWLALVPLEKRQEILGQVQAQGLAEIWAAPDEILELISVALPEKKRNLVLEYSEKNQFTKAERVARARASAWMTFVIQKALAALKSLQENDDEKSNGDGHLRDAA